MNSQESPDNALEDTRGVNTQPGELPLKEDNDPPAAPATDPESRTIPKDHQATDTNVESSEAYGEGVPEASEAGEERQ
jgi:hypothetical protein